MLSSLVCLLCEHRYAVINTRILPGILQAFGVEYFDSMDYGVILSYLT